MHSSLERTRLLAIVLTALLAGCSGGMDEDDAGPGTDSGGVDSGGDVDSGGVDSGGIDAGPDDDGGGTDAGPGDDGGESDGGGSDGGGSDGGGSDGGPRLDGAIGLPDGSIGIPDGGIPPLDGSIGIPDGGISLPDGSIGIPDGGIGLPDAAGGCSATSDCGSAQYCAKGVADCAGRGRCTTVPGGICPGIFMPVCGCDAMTYSNACRAAAAGVNVASTGACP